MKAARGFFDVEAEFVSLMRKQGCVERIRPAQGQQRGALGSGKGLHPVHRVAEVVEKADWNIMPRIGAGEGLRYFAFRPAVNVIRNGRVAIAAESKVVAAQRGSFEPLRGIPGGNPPRVDLGVLEPGELRVQSSSKRSRQALQPIGKPVGVVEDGCCILPQTPVLLQCERRLGAVRKTRTGGGMAWLMRRATG